MGRIVEKLMNEKLSCNFDEFAIFRKLKIINKIFPQPRQTRSF